ncbi:MAG: GNAT family N-acetyltransferase [Patescibacteria group bacterium]|jgi:ribosomal protein S18 acetylase RimI-like enzyme
MDEEATDVQKTSGMCPHGNFPSTPCDACTREAGGSVGESEVRARPELSRVDAADRSAIAAYYQFELNHKFSTLRPGTTFDEMIDFRQQQIAENMMQVVTVNDGSELVATSVVVLKSDTMGKTFLDNEAYAAGTVVDPNFRSGGIGKRVSEEQEKIAQEAGRDAMVTIIKDDNYPSMRLRMGVGYELDGVEEREDEVDYHYRKDLRKDRGEVRDWQKEMESGSLQYVEGEISDASPDQFLLKPNDLTRVKEALEYNYRGVYLLRPEDFPDTKLLTENAVVFVKQQAELEK